MHKYYLKQQATKMTHCRDSSWVVSWHTCYFDSTLTCNHCINVMPSFMSKNWGWILAHTRFFCGKDQQSLFINRADKNVLSRRTVPIYKNHLPFFSFFCTFCIVKIELSHKSKLEKAKIAIERFIEICYSKKMKKLE